MISPDIAESITACARRFNVKAVWLFGSSLGHETEAADIDLAVEGLAPELFFKFYSALFWALPKPVDLVDLSQDTPVARIARATGVRISP